MKARVPSRSAVVAAAILLAAGPAFPIEPGIDIAAPRVALSTVDAQTVRFHPDRIIIEQFDAVRWEWLGGIHDTTGAPECLTSGLWSARLINMSRTFTRLFNEDPDVFDFNCTMHCGLGMVGQVIVTPRILVLVSEEAPQSLRLDWTGGVGPYRVFRSTSPLFTTDTTTILTGSQGFAGATFTDTTADTPPSGTALFYLVMNAF